MQIYLPESGTIVFCQTQGLLGRLLRQLVVCSVIVHKAKFSIEIFLL